MLAGPTSHSFTSQRLKLHYVDWGNEDAPPLLLVHGGRDHCRSWDWVAEAFRKDWHVFAMDLRGHGDSQWSDTGDYSIGANIYDVAQLIHQKKLAPVTLVGHSFGGVVCVRYAGLFPENVRKLVAIEGVGPSPKLAEQESTQPVSERMREWINAKRAISSKYPKKYASLEEAYLRMKTENKYLSDEQARHLTHYGVSQNEDGTFSRKPNNCFRVLTLNDFAQSEIEEFWQNTTCPSVFIHGQESWMSNPADDGRLEDFPTDSVKFSENADYWH